MIRAAAYAEATGVGGLMCRLCPAHCRFREGRRGICGNRFMQGGELVTDNYGEAVSIALDPIEKKPLYHFHPGTEILSTGPNGCNLKCLHCQNWTISQQRVETGYLSPQSLVQAARRCDSIGVAFTYTEPVIWFEYILDASRLLRAADLKVVLVTNGYIDPEPLEELLPWVDAMNIDLKGIRPEFYRRVCKGRVEPILRNIRRVVEAGVHVELTNLIIPTLNDAVEDISALVDFVESVSVVMPLHFSAYRPEYRLEIGATPPKTLLLARDIAARRLKYVYLGNVNLSGSNDTSCPDCGSLLIKRSGYHTLIANLSGSRCAVCGFATGIVR